ncbi:MAG: ABC transporter ATP-binding protein [Candidatus Eisenbacteria bacterium]|uniref:ABC transporter ATP-binding protein n=1 Tax=Eiseniibacteriota bacterium TaxID=2212470 RepID=A0A538U681_UNCEI|nr:MAG: ABC transporter ATP-binding protein [Candidatus Eisenbacteria bacterium]
MNGPALRLERVVKEYRLGEHRVRALDDVSLAVARGEFLAVMGRSGSGKSTLLNLIAGIDTPTSGEVWVDGRELSRLADDDLTRLRRDRVGVIYQFFNLISTLSVRENVALPAQLAGRPGASVWPIADRLIAEVGLASRRDARPHTLSGGELQRAAIARALIMSPPLVLADEPTGNLDSRAAAGALGLLRDLGARAGATVVLVTHSREAAALASRVIEIHDGRIANHRGGPA